MNPTEMPALEIRGVAKKFRKFALEDVSLTVPAGSITALLGPNGAGKTTLLNLIFGVGMAHAGAIRVFGYDHVKEDLPLKHLAAFAGPELNFVAWESVQSALRFLSSFRPTWDAAYEQRLLENFEMEGRKSIRSLSFGEQMKLALVAALAWRPKLLVLDEPTTGLDARARHFLLNELLAVVTDPTRAVLMSSHQLADVERFADRMVILRQGRVLMEGEIASLVEDYAWVQWAAPETAVFRGVTGILRLQGQGGQWRAMVQRSVCTPERLGALGASQLHLQPVTLEELFLNLSA